MKCICLTHKAKLNLGECYLFTAILHWQITPDFFSKKKLMILLKYGVRSKLLLYSWWLTQICFHKSYTVQWGLSIDPNRVRSVGFGCHDYCNYP